MPSSKRFERHFWEAHVQGCRSGRPTFERVQDAVGDGDQVAGIGVGERDVHLELNAVCGRPV